MLKSPRRTFLVLFAAFLLTLVAGLFFRGMVVRDIQRYLETGRPDLAGGGGENIGGPGMRSLRTAQGDLFIKGVDKVLLVWAFLLPGLTLGLGILVLRKPAGSKGKLIQETAHHSEERDPVPGKKTASPEGPGPSMIAAKEEPQSAQDDILDAEDEDMQPLAGDADRITKVVKGLDELAKAQALHGSLQKHQIELAQFMKNIVEKTRGSIQVKDILFNVECGNDLRLTADPACLTGILSNLLDNAAKAVKKGGTVTVSAASEGDKVLVEVRDTGTGISRKALPHIFERFYRGSGNGIGLGLTIVKELVDACGGTIDVRSTRGTGSTFIVRIP